MTDFFQGISDGAGAIILASEEAVKQHGLKPLARLVGYSVVGVEPSIMGIGPSPAIKKLLEKTGKTLNDIDLVEVSVKKGKLFNCLKLSGFLNVSSNLSSLL